MEQTFNTYSVKGKILSNNRTHCGDKIVAQSAKPKIRAFMQNLLDINNKGLYKMSERSYCVPISDEEGNTIYVKVLINISTKHPKNTYPQEPYCDFDQITQTSVTDDWKEEIKAR